MLFVKSSVLAVLLVVLGVIHAAPQEKVFDPVTVPATSVSSLAEKEEITTVPPTRGAPMSTEVPHLEHSSSPAQPAVEEKTTKEAATMQNSQEKSETNSPKLQNQNGSAPSFGQVYPLVFSTASLVLLCAFSLV